MLLLAVLLPLVAGSTLQGREGMYNHKRSEPATLGEQAGLASEQVINEGAEDTEDDSWKQETAPPFEQVPFDRYFYENVFRFSNIHGILRKHKHLISSVVDRSDGKCGEVATYNDFCRKEGRSSGPMLYGHANSQCFLQCDMYGTAFVFSCPPATHWNGKPNVPSTYNSCTQ